MTTYLHVKFCMDYADEFDVYSTWVTTTEEHELFKSTLVNGKYPVELYFGTNECLEFTSASKFFDACEITEISKEEYDTFVKLFGGTQFGTDVSYVQHLVSYCEDDIDF